MQNELTEKAIFQERFNEQFEKLNYTQKKFAEKTEIAPSSVTKYKNGEAIPDMETLMKLAKIFDVSVQYLLGYENVPTYTFEDINKKTGLSQKAIEQLYKFQYDYNPFEKNVDIDITEERKIKDTFKTQLNILNLILEDCGGLFLILDNMNQYKKKYLELEKMKEQTNNINDIKLKEQQELLDLYEYRLTKDFIYFLNKLIKKGDEQQ